MKYTRIPLNLVSCSDSSIGKENSRRKNICRCKDKLAAGIHLRVFVAVSHAAAKLVSKTDLAEYFCNRRIFCKRPECLQIQVTVSMRKIRIFCCDLIPLNDKFCYIPPPAKSRCISKFETISRKLHLWHLPFGRHPA